MAGLDDIVLGNNTKVYYEDSTPNTWVEIPNIQANTHPTDERNLIEIPQFGQTYPRKLAGSATTGNSELTVNYKADETAHQYLLASYKANRKERFKIEVNDPSDSSKGEHMEWRGQVASKNSNAEFDAVFGMVFSLSVDGALGDWTAKS